MLAGKSSLVRVAVAPREWRVAVSDRSTAARTSAKWYENFPEHMKLGLLDFAYSYITRSGRIDDSRLRGMSPLFMARYEASKHPSQQTGSQR